jgi:hypothetical protein
MFGKDMSKTDDPTQSDGNEGISSDIAYFGDEDGQ